MVSWYDEDWTGNDGEEDDHVLKKKGVRVCVLNTQTGKYQHILLVEPFHGANGEVSYRPVDTHAGGMVWYGRFLYLVDTNTNKYLVGYEPVANRFYSHGYRYIMAQSGFWKSPKRSDGKCSTDPGAPPRNSWVSLDRVSTPDRLVVGEFCEVGTGLPGRVVTWDMSDHQIASSARGVATADSAFRQPGLTGGAGNRTQGGVTHDGCTTWHLNSSDGPGNSGLTRSWRLGSGWTLTRSAATPNGPEDMSYWRETGLIWSVSEYHGRRMLYGIAP